MRALKIQKKYRWSECLGFELVRKISILVATSLKKDEWFGMSTRRFYMIKKQPLNGSEHPLNGSEHPLNGSEPDQYLGGENTCFHHPKKYISVEGIPLSGKTTFINTVAAYFPEIIFWKKSAVDVLKFPDFDYKIGENTIMYLAKKLLDYQNLPTGGLVITENSSESVIQVLSKWHYQQGNLKFRDLEALARFEKRHLPKPNKIIYLRAQLEDDPWLEGAALWRFRNNPNSSPEFFSFPTLKELHSAYEYWLRRNMDRVYVVEPDTHPSAYVEILMDVLREDL